METTSSAIGFTVIVVHHYWRSVGCWIRVHIEVNFLAQDRADMFRIVSYQSLAFIWPSQLILEIRMRGS
jgi:hypothetical protein